jgi:hypothetical protein
MSSEFLNQIGLGSVDIGYILLGFLVILIIFIIIMIVQGSKIRTMSKKYSKFMQGKDAKSLEKSIVNLYDSNQILREQTEKNRKGIRELSKIQKNAFQKYGLVKYDAFRQMGGELSFCLVMLNDKDTGYVINTVHSADGSYTYTKEIINGKCKLSLGEEETKALEIALEG